MSKHKDLEVDVARIRSMETTNSCNQSLRRNDDNDDDDDDDERLNRKTWG